MVVSLHIQAFGQFDDPSNDGAASPQNDRPTTGGENEKPEQESVNQTQTTRTAKGILSGTAVSYILPHVDVGLISTTPASGNIFSKLESAGQGWLLEPKIGLSVFSKRVVLDVLTGVQIGSVSGDILGTTDAYDFANAPVVPLNPKAPYKTQQTVPLIEGNARIRLDGKSLQVGFSSTALFGASQALYSSVPKEGLRYAVLLGPQLSYEKRSDEDFFRYSLTGQFLTTGNQRSAFVIKAGAAYSTLFNDPYLKVTENKVVKSKTRLQKQIVTTSEQKLIQVENISFIFNSQTINFRTRSSDLTERSAAFVSGLGQIFAAQREDWKSLLIEGHTDSRGDDAYNKTLSQKRAETVKRVLVQSGLSEADVTAIGLGEERLLVHPEVTDIDFARNRRVELKLQGVKDARVLQRSVTRLQQELFGTAKKEGTSGEADPTEKEKQQ
jgi:outer membrane protein OmpA-like peptidoglycan-associated protein